MVVNLRRTADLLPLIAPYAPLCPDFTMEQAVRMAAIELSERARAWRHIINVEITDAEPKAVLTGALNGDTFDLVFASGAAGTLPPGKAVATIHEIEFAEFNGDKLERIQYSTMNAPQDGKPQYITQIAPSAVSVIPWATGTLRMSVFLKPVADSAFGGDAANPLFDRFNVIPEHYIEKHGLTLERGALYRLLSMPGQPWTDEVKALRNRKEFEAKLDSSFRGNMRGQQRAPIRTKYRDY